MVKNMLLVFLSVFLCSSAMAGSANEDKYDELITEAANQYPNVGFELIKAVIKQESGFISNAGSLGCSGSGADPASCTGAYGLMQLMPATAEGLGVSPGDRGDPRKNIFGGAKYLSQMLTRYDGDIALALAAYNAGPGNVDKYNGVPPFNETIGYVHNVVANYNAYGGTEPTNIASVPPKGSGGSGGRPSAPSGGGAKIGNPSIISLADGAKIISGFESYIGLPSGALENIFKGIVIALLMAFAGIQLIYFFGMPLSGGSLAGANTSTRIIQPFYLSLRTLVLVGFLSFFILN